MTWRRGVSGRSRRGGIRGASGMRRRARCRSRRRWRRWWDRDRAGARARCSTGRARGRAAPAEAVVGLGGLWLPDAVGARLSGALAIAPPSPLRLVLSGRPGSGRRSLAAALAAKAGRRLALIDATLIASARRPLAGA